MNRTPLVHIWMALLSLVLTAAGCRGGTAAPRVEPTDSAGIAIILTRSADVPVPLSSARVRSVGDDNSDTETIYRVNSGNTGVDANGNIYVLQTDAHRVHVFDSTGRHVRSLGARGGGPGELELPLGLIVSPDGVVSVADAGKRKFVQWNGDGQLLGELRMPQGYYGGPAAWTKSGMVVSVYFAGGQQLLLVDSSGMPTKLAAVQNLAGKTLDLKSCKMGFTNMPPIFSPDLVWTADGDRVTIARNPNYVIDEYVGGRLTRSFRRDVPPRAATADDAKASLGDGMRVRVQGSADRVCDPAEVVEQQGFAPHLPAIERMSIAPGGQLWVQRYTVGDEPGAIDLFESDGRYIGTVSDGTSFPIRFLPDGRMLTSEVDLLDVEKLVIRVFEGWR